MYDHAVSSLMNLLKSGHKYTIPKGQVLHFDGSHMFINLVESGCIKRYLITDAGEQSIQVMYGRGDIFPLTPVFKELLNLEIYHGEEVLYYEALTETVLYVLDRDAFTNAVENNVTLYKDLLYVAGQRLGSNIQRLENQSLRSSNRKIVDMLLYFAEKFGSKTSEGIMVEIPLTHQTIADLLSITRETASHTMARLQERNLVSYTSKIITIPDITALKSAR